MKALILAAGNGNRLGTEDTIKCMVQVAGKPLVEYSLDQAIEVKEIDQIVMVVGYKASLIIDHYRDFYKGKPIQYVLQPVRDGIVGAIGCSKEALGEEDFVLMLGDEIFFDSNLESMLKFFLSPPEEHPIKKENFFGLCGMLWTREKSRICKTYTAGFDTESMIIYRLVEKPTIPFNHWLGTGTCVFRNEILNYIDLVLPNPKRGEKDLVDLIQVAVDDGGIFLVYKIANDFVNVNTREDLKAAEILLSAYSMV